MLFFYINIHPILRFKAFFLVAISFLREENGFVSLLVGMILCLAASLPSYFPHVGFF